MASFGPGDFNVEAVARQVRARAMLNRHLQHILIAENQKSGGVKADLQHRIVDRLQYHAGRKDLRSFNRLKAMIERPEITQDTAQTNGVYTDTPVYTTTYPGIPGHKSQLGMGGGPNGYQGQGSPNLFKPSPFYTLQEQIGTTKMCDVMTQHRQTITMNLKVADHAILSRVSVDPSLKIKVFCRTDAYGAQDIAFPQQADIKVNGGEVKANLRGLKSKPGSTRPADITKDLRLTIPHYNNIVDFTYALTNKKFYLSIYVVKVVEVPELVKRLETGRRITKVSVLRDMVNKARDPDVVTTSSVLSLKCPLSTLRIDLPCRSISCRHNQCFDATSYLQLQEQGPTWLCPICNNPAIFENLVVDDYVKDILERTSRSVDQVNIEPEGEWKLTEKSEPKPGPNDFGSEDDEDLVVVTKSGHNIKTDHATTFNAVQSGIGGPTQTQSQPQPPSLQYLSGAISGKRPISAVIDLTSDDDDDAPLRAPKRQHSNGGITQILHNQLGY